MVFITDGNHCFHVRILASHDKRLKLIKQCAFTKPYECVVEGENASLVVNRQLVVFLGARKNYLCTILIQIQYLNDRAYFAFSCIRVIEGIITVDFLSIVDEGR